MRDQFRRAASSALVLALFVPTLAGAQSRPDAQVADAKAAAGGLEEVIVTAEKRRESLQVTPISISVLGSEGIKNRHVTSLVDLGDGAIPSLKVAPFFSRPGALIMNIRGIGVLSDSNQPARDQGVGVYVDGVYLGRPQGLGTALYDIESIEVLKGPQGTLFGRNTEGGAVSIVTKKPRGEFQMVANAGAGNYGSYKTDLHLDLPKVANLSLKFDGVATERDGWVDNPLPGAKDFGGYKKHGYHVALLWEPLAKFNALYSFDHFYDASTTLYQQLIAPGSLPTAPIATVQADRASVANVGVPQQASIGKGLGHRLGLEWSVTDNMTVKSISAYRRLTQGQYDNGSAAVTMLCAPGSCNNFNFSRYSLAQFKQDQVSEEIQVVGDIDRFKYLFGGLYYQETVDDNAQAFATNQFNNAAGTSYIILPLDYSKQRVDRASHVKTTSQGVFGQVTYTPPLLGDALHLTVGGRQTEDKKEGQLNIINGALPSVNGVSAARILNSKWNRFDPLVNVGYDVTKDILVYGKWSTGYRSGGANSRSLFYSPFNPETVEMFEAGAKTEFLDRRARFNVAGYTGTYKSIQLDFSALYQQTDPVTGKLLTTLRTTTETTNAPGNGKLNGVEGDFTFAVTDRLTLSASFAHNIVEIPATLNPFPQANGLLITVPIPIYQVYTPENTASFGIDYDRPLWGATFLAHVDGNYDSGYYANYTDVAYNSVTRAVTVPQPKGDSAFLLNARVALADIPMGGGLITVSVWSRNLLNEQHLFYKSQSVTAGVMGFFNEPRTYGFEASVKY